MPPETDEGLRAEKYNAAITFIREHNPDLWIVRVRPDDPPESYEPGQYTTLGLGYWEPKSNGAVDPLDEERRTRLALRSYSVSSPIVDDDGELVTRDDSDFEFYIVRVRPGQELPALTPRLFAKGIGDRIYMGRKFAGRYTLQGVGPDDNILFLSTGTGEAPQNAMTAELLRRGHRGRILNVVCVRFRDDLAYTEQQAMVERRWPTYRYHAFTTREPGDDSRKVYIQDLVADGTVETLLEAPLDPKTTHVFVCGNPAMIGLPRWDDDGTLHFPETVGVCQLLHERGFTLDHRRERGNVHYEEYWKDRVSADA
jgi:ferredoxin/flavodoxin---NADP+ reductase